MPDPNHDPAGEPRNRRAAEDEAASVIFRSSRREGSQVDGEIQGDIHCGSLLLGDTAQVVGGVIAEDIVVRGRVVGSIRGVRVTLQAQSHIEGDIIHQSLAIEQGAYFEGKSRRTDNPLEEVKASSAGSPRPVHKPSDFDSKPHDEASAPRAAESDATDNPGAEVLPVPAAVGTMQPTS